jgi:hypothetical protein
MTAPQEPVSAVSAIHPKISQEFQGLVDPTKNFRKFQIFTTLIRFHQPTHIIGSRKRR